MAGDGFEPFEVNEYDLENAFNPLKKRRNFTKHQQLYGVFADSDDDDEEVKGDNFGRGGGGKKRNDYTAPMNFVSGGVKNGDKIEENTEEQTEDRDSPIEIIQTKRTKFSSKIRNIKFDDTSSFAGIRNFSSAGPSAAAGNMEKTYGIGAKLLSKMGYVPGKGLGKSGQGIVEPIEAAVRPGRGAVGAYGAEKTGVKTVKSQSAARTFDSGEEGEKSEPGRRGGDRWRKNAAKTTVKAKQNYRTWDDVVAEGGTMKKRLLGEHTSVKVIDMTGKEKKVFTGYDVFRYRTREPGSDDDSDEAIGTGQKAERTRAFDVPELMHNLDMLVDVTEETIVQNDRQLNFLKDQKVALVHDEDQLSKTIQVEEKQVDRMNSMIALFDRFERKEADGQLTLDDCMELFRELQRDYYEEYKAHGLSSIAATNVLPLIKEYFSQWRPLDDSDYGYDMLDEWRSIFAEGSSNYTSQLNFGDRGSKLENMHPYHRLLWEGWMPSLRRCALEWDPKIQCDEMVNLVNRWQHILPGWILENVLEQIILPRLQREVEHWNPMTDRTPIHFWLHPWLPLMGHRLQPVYGPIRHKLGRALAQWHPSDASAKNVLKPWKDVFLAGSMQNFLSQYILPKLELCLAELQVNPVDQDLRRWNWVMDWLDMIHPSLITDSLIRNFFPKWHQTLITWLQSTTANYNEITQWYAGWKTLIHADLMAFQPIRDQFNHALEIMNQAMNAGAQGVLFQPVQPQIPGPSSLERQRAAAEIHQRHIDILSSRASESMAPSNFKDLVEKTAEESGLLMMPIPSKFREGKPVYQFGSCQVYVDRNVVFMLQPRSGQWIPVSLEQLVTSARQ